MFQRLSTGWQLACQSFHVLRLDKELLLFPLLSGMACMLVLASFAGPLWYTDGMAALEEGDVTKNPVVLVVMFAFYAVNYFVIVFFNSALVACAMIRFKGGDPTVGDGLRAASRRLPQIAGWALVSATVGLILRIIESRSERVGQFVAALLGMAWTVTTYFVVPILVVEKAGPVEACRRSVSIMKRTWGESLSASFSAGLINFLLGLPGLILIVPGMFLIVNGSPAPGIGLIVAGVVLLLLASLVSSAVNTILLAALYLYATEGNVPEYFDRDLIAHSFERT
ncbi:MAG: DUF6159 family protein [Fuerstiella sp.]|nr:DUF6159 family protein [Fuerstiella sp.]